MWLRRGFPGDPAFAKLAELTEAAFEEMFTCYAFPGEHWRRIRVQNSCSADEFIFVRGCLGLQPRASASASRAANVCENLRATISSREATEQKADDNCLQFLPARACAERGDCVQRGGVV